MLSVCANCIDEICTGRCTGTCKQNSTFLITVLPYEVAL